MHTQNKEQSVTRLLVATNNPGKVKEYEELLKDLPVEITFPAQEGAVLDVEETGLTFEENARIKALAFAHATGLLTLADDSGLEVDALDGGPGVYTKRYAGPDAGDEDNNSKLLRELEGLPPEERGARYQCVLAYWEPASGDEPVFRDGQFEGRIASERRGTGGFGYDPIFEPEDEAPGGRTVGQMSADEKHALSHRGKAARAMAEYLRGEGW